jgi:copper chaperone CopZ
MELKAARIMGLTVLAGLLAWGCGQTKAETAEVSLKSAVCELCANRIQTAVAEMEGVRKVEVDIENQLAQVTFNSGKTSLVAIETMISELGYSANDRPADAVGYAKLPACCQVGGEHEKAKMEL